MLFENNNFDDNYGIDLTFLNIPINSMNDKNNNDLYDAREGFLKGNMFKDEYLPYKNYAIMQIVPKDKKEELELKIYELDFAINDLNLHLDLHPDDKEMFDLFKHYIKKANSYKEEYINLVGPICLTDVTGNNYNWLSSWPWEGKGGNI